MMNNDKRKIEVKKYSFFFLWILESKNAMDISYHQKASKLSCGGKLMRYRVQGRSQKQLSSKYLEVPLSNLKNAGKDHT